MNDRNYRGNGGRTGAGRRVWSDANAPRVGRIRDDVPTARRFGEEEPESRGYRGANDRNTRTYNTGSNRYTPRDGGEDIADPKKRNERARANRVREAIPEELPENLLVGRNPIREAIRAGRPVEKLLVSNGDLSGSAREIVGMAREAGVIVQNVDRTRLDQIYPAHQGMLAYVAPVSYVTVDEILAVAEERGEEALVVVLDGITDPHNLGAIIRSAECVGAHGVIIPERRASGLTPAAAKAAAGALSYMKIARVTNISRTLEELKEKGLWVLGTAMDGTDVFTTDLTGPTALVIGSEGEGMARLVREKCDMLVALPMKGHIDSLNASVAAGVMLYEIARARHK